MEKNETKNIADLYSELVKMFEEQMSKENVQLWWFNMYLPDIFAQRILYEGITKFIEIRERNDKNDR